MKTSFVAPAAVLAAALLTLVHSSSQSKAQHLVLVSENEPGQHLIIRGIVYAPDGVTPVSGLQLGVHNADSMGYYCMPPSEERDHTLPRDNCPDAPPTTARIRGSLTTDAQGRFEIHTVKPGAYPRRNIPAHIHFKAFGAGYPEQWLHDLNFAGDPFLPAAEVDAARQAGKFSYVCEPQRERDALVCAYNIRLERK